MKKTPVGPIAEKKKIKNDPVPLSPGYEDPIKIQRVQREGLTPNSQKFGKLASNNRKGPFKMKGFSGYGNSPAKKIVGGGTGPSKHGTSGYSKDNFYKDQTVRDDRGNKPRVKGAGGVASKQHNKTYKKVGEYRQAGNVEMFNTQVKKAAKEMKNAQRLNENFRKGMSIQRKRMAIDQAHHYSGAKKSGGKIKQTPKPTTTQKIKNFFGL